jgi:molybdopterin synthase sulfur carrier subunit
VAKLDVLGRLEDIAGAPEIALAPLNGATLGQILAGIPAELAAALGSPRIRIAVNGVLVPTDRALDDLTVSDSDEIAFLPPVSGG